MEKIKLIYEFTFQQELAMIRILSDILREPDVAKRNLNLDELLNVAVCNGNRDEIRLINAIVANPEDVEKLSNSLNKGNLTSAQLMDLIRKTS